MIGDITINSNTMFTAITFYAWSTPAPLDGGPYVIIFAVASMLTALAEDVLFMRFLE
jgi:hypothetical protein